MIAIIDSGGANIASVTFALERCGATATLTTDAEMIASADKVILPGVGAAPVVRDEDCTALAVIRDCHVARRAMKACSISDSRHQEGTYNEVYRGNYSARPVVSSA